MAEKRKARRRKEEYPEKISAEEKEIAKHLRQELPNKKTMLFNHKVNFFVASKAVDCLLDSKWASKSRCNQPLFTTRESVVSYLELMLFHKFFHRARKIAISSNDTKKKKKDDSSDDKEGKKKGSLDKRDECKKDKKKDDDEKKKKKKFKLDMHLEQSFVDGKEIYVWIYDPIPKKAWVIGGFIVIGAILLCLFPLWPQSVRKGVYYLSLVAAGFLVIILGLAVLRILVFGIAWAVTFGKHHLWLFPNLTEDVGFLESFWPLYQYEYRGDECATEEEKNDKASENETTKTPSEVTACDENQFEAEFEVLGVDNLSENQSEEECESPLITF